MLTFRRIEQLAKRFPGIETSTSYGTPALKVARKLILRMHDREDAIVVLLNTLEEQQQLLSRDPMQYFITDHYAGYAAVLVRPTLEEAEFLALLQLSWRRVARKMDIAAFNEQHG